MENSLAVLQQTHMNSPLLFVAQGFIVLLGVIVLAVVLHRRLPAMWRSWVWGALSFIASQAVRIPLLLALTAFLQLTNLIPPDTDPNIIFAINFVVLTLTSGLFEEGARYLVLRFLAKETRGWNEAVMFGAGHGGIEAILLVALTAFSNAFVLMNAESLLAQTQAAAPASADALAQQIDALRNVGIGLIGASLLERVFAIMLHIGLSVMVMQAVQGHGLKWLFLAMLIHAAANGAVLMAQRAFGVVGAEVAVALFGLSMLAYTLRMRPPKTAEMVNAPA
jgi:uncharacterized membrane protein YhfC